MGSSFASAVERSNDNEVEGISYSGQIVLFELGLVWFDKKLGRRWIVWEELLLASSLNVLKARRRILLL